LNKTLLRHRVVHGKEPWTMNFDHKDTTGVLKHKILKRISGAVKQGGKWRIR
jgi:hypothetical protein